MEVGLANREVVVVCLLTTMILLSLPATDARSSGPPVEEDGLCTDMTPQHGGTLPSSPPPYTIATGGTCYTPQQPITGKISN